MTGSWFPLESVNGELLKGLILPVFSKVNKIFYFVLLLFMFCQFIMYLAGH